MLDPSHQGVKRLFVLAYHNTEGDDRVSVDSHQQYFLPRVKVIILKSMEETSTISRLMTWLSNMMKSEKY